MTDPRLIELAHILVDKCIDTQTQEKIWVRAIGLEAVPLAREVYKRVIQLGAVPVYDIADEQVQSYYYKHATPEQLTHKPDITEFIARNVDKSIAIFAESNKRELAEADPKKMLERAKATKAVSDIIMSKPWVLTQVPTTGEAQAADMSLEDYEDYYFRCTNRDWSKIEAEMKKLADRLTQAKELRIKGDGTDLRMSVTGRKWIYNDWKANMPGGEVFTSPVRDSVEGEIYFEYPRTFRQKTIAGIRLSFKRGRVVKATATHNEEYLQAILATDEEACTLGEVAFGGNPGVVRYMDNLLFDEKMAGTMHCALGRGFVECGGDATGSIHMDIVKEMRKPGSEVWLDGELLDPVHQVRNATDPVWTRGTTRQSAAQQSPYSPPGSATDPS